MTFTPTSTTQYTTATHAANVTVNQLTPTVSSWPTASSITYGQALSSFHSERRLYCRPLYLDQPQHDPRRGHAFRERDLHANQFDVLQHDDEQINVTVNQVTPIVSVWPTAFDHRLVRR